MKTNQFLESILKMSQSELKASLSEYLRKMKYPVQSQNGFVYAEGEVPVLLVAHLDTVHRSRVKIVCYSADGKFAMSPEGIGGDDRAGVYMILKIIKEQRCHVLFCEDEEIGGRGAQKFVDGGIIPKVNYIVELDRRGDNDAVFYGCDNPDFTKFVLSFGFDKAYGTFSDISVIAPALGIAAVNISAGYYNEHTQHEYINLPAMRENAQRVAVMAGTGTEAHRYIEVKRFTFCEYEYEPIDFFNYLGHNSSNERFKELMPMPDSAYMMMNGALVENGEEYLMDERGKVYYFVDELNAAVESDYLLAYSESGLPLHFDGEKAKKIKVLSYESALELLKQADLPESV